MKPAIEVAEEFIPNQPGALQMAIAEIITAARVEGAVDMRERAAECGDKCSGAFMGAAIRALDSSNGQAE